MSDCGIPRNSTAEDLAGVPGVWVSGFPPPGFEEIITTVIVDGVPERRVVGPREIEEMAD